MRGIQRAARPGWHGAGFVHRFAAGVRRTPATVAAVFRAQHRPAGAEPAPRPSHVVDATQIGRRARALDFSLRMRRAEGEQ